MARNWIQRAVLVWALMATVPVMALDVAVSGQDADRAARFASALSESTQRRVVTVTPDRAELHIALDAESFRQALNSGDAVIGVDIPRELALRAYRDDCHCTALFAGADPLRQLRLIRKLLPAATRVGVLLGPESGWVENRLEEAPESASLHLEIDHLSDPDQLGPALSRLLSRVDVLLAPRDPQLYNPATARLLLLSSYRQDRPVIGPDAEFVRAGSLATTYSSGYDLVIAVGALLDAYSESGALPAPHFPGVFSVTVNEHVMRAQDLPAPDPRQLTAELREQEKSP